MLTIPIALVATLLFFIILLVIAVIAKSRHDLYSRYEFISIVSHKFRTPLTSIRWLTENLIATEKDSFRKKDIGDVQAFNQQLIDLTNTLIELTETEKFSKGQYKLETIVVDELVKQSVASLKDLFGVKNITLAVNSADPSLKVRVDRNRFDFALHAVLENSAMYTKPGGRAELSVTSTHRRVVITIADNGIGILKSDIKRIFSEFYRAPKGSAFNTEGLGIGLYLSRRIVTRLGGKILAYSPGEGKGSIFKITLPKVK